MIKKCRSCIIIRQKGGNMLEIVVGFDENRLIGDGINLPWHISEDLKHFKKLTSNHRVIMGRVTYESIGRLLPNRENIILSKNKEYNIEGARRFTSVKELLENLDDQKRNFVIGGSRIYKELLPYVNILHISHIKGSYKGDTYFPHIDLGEYEKVEEIEYSEFVYCVYKKR